MGTPLYLRKNEERERVCGGKEGRGGKSSLPFRAGLVFSPKTKKSLNEMGAPSTDPATLEKLRKVKKADVYKN